MCKGLETDVQIDTLLGVARGWGPGGLKGTVRTGEVGTPGDQGPS